MILSYHEARKLDNLPVAAVLLVIIGLGGRCRRLIGVSASAPAFVVVSILYIWSVYATVVRQGGFLQLYPFLRHHEALL